MNRPPPDYVFIIGTGRSGTHWLAHVLRSHLDFRVNFERFPMFPLVVRMALYPRSRKLLLPVLVASYRAQRLASGKRIYADKSHPAIWIAEQLADALPGAFFLGVQRNPFATVSSMMRVDGVRAWHERWQRYPVPNEFLGITRELAASYGDLSLAAQCALRWRVHRERMEALASALGDRLHVVSYERLASAPEAETRVLQERMGLATPFPRPDVNRHAVQRWRELLTDEQIADVTRTVGFGPDSV